MKNTMLVLTSLAIMVAAFLMGCGGTPKSPPPYHPDPSLVTVAVNKAATGSAKVEAHLDSAERGLQQVVEVAPPSEQPMLRNVSQEHAAAKDALTKEVNPQLEQAMKDKATADAAALKATGERDAAIGKWSADYSALEGKWYVVWGRRIEAFIWWAVAIWVGLGVASVVLGLGNPLGWLATASNGILHLIPVGNVFAWIRAGVQKLFDLAQLGHQAVKAGAIPPRLLNSQLNGAGNISVGVAK